MNRDKKTPTKHGPKWKAHFFFEEFTFIQDLAT